MSFKEVVNEALRRGIGAQDLKARRQKPFRVEPFCSAFRPGVDPMKLGKLADELEIERASTPASASGGR